MSINIDWCFVALDLQGGFYPLCSFLFAIIPVSAVKNPTRSDVFLLLKAIYSWSQSSDISLTIQEPGIKACFPTNQSDVVTGWTSPRGVVAAFESPLVPPGHLARHLLGMP